MAKDKPARPPFHEEFAAKLVEDLKQGTAPWQKPWRPGQSHSPRNPISGTVYSGINRVMLARRGFEDPRWMSFKQANTLECRVRKGEKAQTIVYWQFDKEIPAVDDNGKPVLNAEGEQLKEKVELTRPIVRFSSVFHISQLEGEIPPLDPATLELKWDPNEKAETILQNSGAVIKHNQRDRAFYSLLTDEISLPPKENFAEADGYYATALHELGHHSGHPSRLNREFGPFGSETYAREELRAEIASWMLGQDIGIGHDPGQHLAYVKSWVSILEKDPYEIVRACRDAEKIKQYVLGLEQKQELGQTSGVPVAQEVAQETSVAQEPATGKIFLGVPFRQKEAAKAAGAKWDRAAKLWYAPEGADLTRLKTWLPENAAEKGAKPAQSLGPVDEFARAIAAAGLDLAGQAPVMDGSIHRAPLQDAKPGRLDGAYLGHLDGIPAGFIQNHKTGDKITWKATGHVLSEEQKASLKIEAAQRQAEQQRQRLQQQVKASKRAFAKFVNAREASPEQPYLAKKGVPPLGVREDAQGNLLVPGRDASGHIHTLQTITPDGKFFEPGGRKQGAFFMIDPEDQGHVLATILIAEGYATAASLHVATGLPVAVAFDAGNLEPVALALRKNNPAAAILLAADDDHALNVNVGLEKAALAARAVNGSILAPQLTHEEKARGLTDFNDIHQARGLEPLKRLVNREIERQLKILGKGRDSSHELSLER